MCCFWCAGDVNVTNSKKAIYRIMPTLTTHPKGTKKGIMGIIMATSSQYLGQQKRSSNHQQDGAVKYSSVERRAPLGSRMLRHALNN